MLAHLYMSHPHSNQEPLYHHCRHRPDEGQTHIGRYCWHNQQRYGKVTVSCNCLNHIELYFINNKTINWSENFLPMQPSGPEKNVAFEQEQMILSNAALLKLNVDGLLVMLLLCWNERRLCVIRHANINTSALNPIVHPTSIVSMRFPSSDLEHRWQRVSLIRVYIAPLTMFAG